MTRKSLIERVNEVATKETLMKIMDELDIDYVSTKTELDNEKLVYKVESNGRNRNMIDRIDFKFSEFMEHVEVKNMNTNELDYHHKTNKVYENEKKNNVCAA